MAEYRVWVYGRGNSGQILPLRELGMFADKDQALVAVRKEVKRLVKLGFRLDEAFVKWGNASVNEFRKDGTMERRGVAMQAQAE